MRVLVRRLVDALLVAALVGAVALLGLAQSTPDGIALVDMDGRRVTLDADPAAGSTDVRATGGRFQAPSRGVDVPLLEMTAVGGVLNPPTLTDAFLVRDPERTSGDRARPRVVVVHAVRGGRAPGNALLSPEGDAPGVRAGEELRLDGLRYTVSDTEVLPQSDVARSPAIWERQQDGAGRLVVITCVTGGARTGPASHNLVVHAVR